MKAKREHTIFFSHCNANSISWIGSKESNNYYCCIRGPYYFCYPALSSGLIGKHSTKALQIFYLTDHADTLRSEDLLSIELHLLKGLNYNLKVWDLDVSSLTTITISYITVSGKYLSWKAETSNSFWKLQQL